MKNAYYFGCIERPGHFLWGENGRHLYGNERLTTECPWGEDEVDGDLTPHRQGCKKGPYCGCGMMPEGEAVIHHKDGWTALSFWDRSVDKRGACNSNFFIKGTYDFTTMLNLVCQRFPSIVARFKFPITEYTTTRV